MSASLDPQLVFDRFVVGPDNRMAAAAARRAAESPGRSYNPLVICGPPGLGKTHLLHAIGHLACEVDPELRLQYESLESFVDRLSAGIAEGTLEEFRTGTASLGLVLLDDLQLVAGKVRTQEELLRLWDELVQQGSQVVIASDRAPAEIPAIDSRLRSRLAAGLIVDVGPLEEPTRLAILERLLEERGISLPEGMPEAIARLPIANVRELQGGLNRVLAQAELEGRAPRPETLAELLGLPAAEAGAEGDEFGDFLSDISTAVAAVVEMAPWRRRIAQAILRWEGEGVRTRRLEAALDADSAPDVDALLDGFARDVARLRQARQKLTAPPADPTLLTDPDRVAELEALVAEAPAPRPAPGERPRPRRSPSSEPDRWFLDREKLAWSWLALDDRVMEEG